jgi:hypothetical protein
VEGVTDRRKKSRTRGDEERKLALMNKRQEVEVDRLYEEVDKWRLRSVRSGRIPYYCGEPRGRGADDGRERESERE